MAIPVHLQQFKAAGIYRVVFDKSTVLGVNAEVLRLVVGYSEQGPFNIPTYITSTSDFRAIYGDISKKLEKRGMFFHRVALQALGSGPILCLNLKKFDGETLDGASINTEFNPTFEPIDTVELNVEDIYDTTRFWELSAEKLNDLRAIDGRVMDQYINICSTNTIKGSATYFIRKASGNKVSAYNLSVSDWYSDKAEEMPDYLADYGNLRISDFFAEIYVFSGKFTAAQVLASSTLKNYFEVDMEHTDEEGLPLLKLRNHITNAYGEYVDTLDALYNDATSGALGHYIGSLIPYFRNKQGAYMSLDIIFNSDNDIHNMMMSFNSNLLDDSDEAIHYIDLSGRSRIEMSGNKVTPENLFNKYSVTTTLLGNNDSPIIVNKIDYVNNAVKTNVDGQYVAAIQFDNSPKRILGTLYVSGINTNKDSFTGKKIKMVPNPKYDEEQAFKTVMVDNPEYDKNQAFKTIMEPNPEYSESDAQEAQSRGEEYNVPKEIEKTVRNEEYTVPEKIEQKVPNEEYEVPKEIEENESYEDKYSIVIKHIGNDDLEKDDDGALKIRESILLFDNLDNLWAAAEKLGAAKSYSINKFRDIRKTQLTSILQAKGINGDELTVKINEIVDAIDSTKIDDENPYYSNEYVYVTKNTAYIINYNSQGTYFCGEDNGNEDAFIICENNGQDLVGKFTLEGPQKVITAITRIEELDETSTDEIENILLYEDVDGNLKANIVNVVCQEYSTVETHSVYGPSITFIKPGDGWEIDGDIDANTGLYTIKCDKLYDNSLFNSLRVGDCFLADSQSKKELDGNNYFDNVFVQQIYTESNDVTGEITNYCIAFSDKPYGFSTEIDNDGSQSTTGDIGKERIIYLVRIDRPLNQEIGTLNPQYLKGYVYNHDKPAGTSMNDKLEWQKFILSTLTDYKGLRIGLLNKSDIDYRYIIDTFESYVDEECKQVLSFLAKEKQSAFAILNFPAVKTFVKCPYSSYTDANGYFNVQYIVDGANRRKPAAKMFSLPSDSNGASFCAFYTPLRFSDGYVDTTVPSAGLVSNLFMEKYTSREPYYIIAGPNYGSISTSGLVGPDYKYSQEELNIIEPYGVNCMIYRPGFGTFINANQTAKQVPVSALSKVNVRELVIYLQDEIEKVLQSYQWEFNNVRTRNAILNRANDICSRVLATGGLQAFLNVMDESNNGPEIIDNEMAVLSTHIEPGMGCGKMVHELTLYRTGQMKSNVLD